MRIPMGTVTRDYLRAHRLAPTQCASNMFRILGSVDALNEKNGLNPYPLGFPGRFKGVARWPPLPDEREATRWGFRSRFISSKLPFLHFDAFCTFFFFLLCWYLNFPLICAIPFFYCVS